MHSDDAHNFSEQPSANRPLHSYQINLSDQDFQIERGMRIAQMIIAPFTQAQLKLVDSLESSERGDRGFGSTGVKQKYQKLANIQFSQYE